MVRSRIMNGVADNASRQIGRRWSPMDKARALERLATARANLAGLERQAAPPIDPEIRRAVEHRQQQIVALHQQVRAGKRGRAGKQARQQIEALEGTQRLVIECLGFRSYDEFHAAISRADAARVDDRVLAAAREEVNRAERHFFDTAEMAVPVPTPPPPPAPPAPYAGPQPVPSHRPMAHLPQMPAQMPPMPTMPPVAAPQGRYRPAPRWAAS